MSNYLVRKTGVKYGVFRDGKLYSKHATSSSAYDAMIILQRSLGSIDRSPTRKKRSHRLNPRLQNMFVIIAKRAGSPALKYIGGIRFAARGRAVLFPSRKGATTVARELKLRFPVLKAYTLSVQS